MCFSLPSYESCDDAAVDVGVYIVVNAKHFFYSFKEGLSLTSPLNHGFSMMLPGEVHMPGNLKVLTCFISVLVL